MRITRFDYDRHRGAPFLLNVNLPGHSFSITVSSPGPDRDRRAHFPNDIRNITNRRPSVSGAEWILQCMLNFSPILRPSAFHSQYPMDIMDLFVAAGMARPLLPHAWPARGVLRDAGSRSAPYAKGMIDATGSYKRKSKMKKIAMLCFGLVLVSTLMGACAALTRSATSQNTLPPDDQDSIRSQGEGGWHGGK
jgi:hypothetical protein